MPHSLRQTLLGSISVQEVATCPNDRLGVRSIAQLYRVQGTIGWCGGRACRSQAHESTVPCLWACGSEQSSQSSGVLLSPMWVSNPCRLQCCNEHSLSGARQCT